MNQKVQQYEVIKAFKGSPDGCRVVEFKPGQIIEVGEDFSEGNLAAGFRNDWILPVKPAAKPVAKKRAARRK